MAEQTTLPLEGGGHTVEEVIASLRRLRIQPITYESELHDQIAERLRTDGIAYQHEVTLGPRNRIDFMVPPGIGIEVKKGKPTSSDLTAQAERYAAFDQIRAIILVVERNVFWYPEAIDEKPVHYIACNRLWGIAL